MSKRAYEQHPLKPSGQGRHQLVMCPECHTPLLVEVQLATQMLSVKLSKDQKAIAKMKRQLGIN